MQQINSVANVAPCIAENENSAHSSLQPTLVTNTHHSLTSSAVAEQTVISPDMCRVTIRSLLEKLCIIPSGVSSHHFSEVLKILSVFSARHDAIRHRFQQIDAMFPASNRKFHWYASGVMASFKHYTQNLACPRQHRELSLTIALFYCLEKILCYEKYPLSIEVMTEAMRKEKCLCFPISHDDIMGITRDVEHYHPKKVCQFDLPDYTPYSEVVDVSLWHKGKEPGRECQSFLADSLQSVGEIIQAYNFENKAVILVFDFDNAIFHSDGNFVGVTGNNPQEKIEQIKQGFHNLAQVTLSNFIISARKLEPHSLNLITNFLHEHGLAEIFSLTPSKKVEDLQDTDGFEYIKFPESYQSKFGIRSLNRGNVFISFWGEKIDIIHENILSRIPMRHGTDAADCLVVLFDDDQLHHDVAWKKTALREAAREVNYDLILIKPFPVVRAGSVYDNL